MSPRPAALLAVAALAAAVLTGCGEDAPEPGPSAGTPPPSSASPAAPSSSAPASPESSEVPEDEGPPFPADTTEDTEDSDGGQLTVVDARVAAQDGYDRVVLELDGAADGAPGWFVGYVDVPTAQGSGEVVDVEGASFLAVTVTGVGLPVDTGVEELPRTTLTADGLGAVTEVVLGSQFEGQYEAFVGLTGEPRPFRVFRLADPARVVIDVQTG